MKRVSLTFVILKFVDTTILLHMVKMFSVILLDLRWCTLDFLFLCGIIHKENKKKLEI